MKKIDFWRERIDDIDLQLVKLLNERSQCAIEIGKIKARLDIEIYDPEREKEVIHNVQEATEGPLTREALRRLFERIIDESRRAERESRSVPVAQDRQNLQNRSSSHGHRHEKRRHRKSGRSRH